MEPLTYTTQQTAQQLHISLTTLRRWNTTGTGPPCYRTGRRLLYPVEDLLAWLRDQPRTAYQRGKRGVVPSNRPEPGRRVAVCGELADTVAPGCGPIEPAAQAGTVTQPDVAQTADDTDMPATTNTDTRVAADTNTHTVDDTATTYICAACNTTTTQPNTWAHPTTNTWYCTPCSYTR